ncbi:unnamed protein product [Effrenium voratum]|uniref:J domain-containing protein n=1 Tax=Effrenium voratum TaxID=2562239 RepID=A0AA36IU10_9DINO|nr:unnamed protein product [Effrenium voratum]
MRNAAKMPFLDGPSKSFRSHYDELGVSRSAAADEIRRAYRHKARELHPDKCSEPDAQARFIRVNQAYEILSNPVSRRSYDLTLDAHAHFLRAGPAKAQAASDAIYELLQMLEAGIESAVKVRELKSKCERCGVEWPTCCFERAHLLKAIARAAEGEIDRRVRLQEWSRLAKGDLVAWLETQGCCLKFALACDTIDKDKLIQLARSRLSEPSRCTRSPSCRNKPAPAQSPIREAQASPQRKNENPSHNSFFPSIFRLPKAKPKRAPRQPKAPNAPKTKAPKAPKTKAPKAPKAPKDNAKANAEVQRSPLRPFFKKAAVPPPSPLSCSSTSSSSSSDSSSSSSSSSRPKKQPGPASLKRPREKQTDAQKADAARIEELRTQLQAVRAAAKADHPKALPALVELEKLDMEGRIDLKRCTRVLGELNKAWWRREVHGSVAWHASTLVLRVDADALIRGAKVDGSA